MSNCRVDRSREDAAHERSRQEVGGWTADPRPARRSNATARGSAVRLRGMRTARTRPAAPSRRRPRWRPRRARCPADPVQPPPWAPKGPAQGAGRGQATHVQTGLLRARQARELPPPALWRCPSPCPAASTGTQLRGMALAWCDGTELHEAPSGTRYTVSGDRGHFASFLVITQTSGDRSPRTLLPRPTSPRRRRRRMRNGTRLEAPAEEARPRAPPPGGTAARGRTRQLHRPARETVH